MMISHYGDESIKIRIIDTPDFEVSRAGSCPWRPDYCFGSDDGRVLFIDLDGTWRDGPYDVSPSGEAVNGIAFTGGLMAVSTRSDVTFLNASDLGRALVERAVFYGGAHGVIGTKGGCFVAPLGRRGILLMEPKPDRAQSVRILTAPGTDFYFYKIISLGHPDRGEILACAGRKGGLVAIPLAGVGLENYGKWLRPVGVDFVDVSPLGIEGFPFATAGLGVDGSIYLVRDLLTDKTSKRLHYTPTGERAYRILCTEGHIVLLTDKSLYAFVDLATRFLQGEDIDGPILAGGRRLGLEAVDVSLASDRSLLVVMPDSVWRIGIDSLVQREESPVDPDRKSSHSKADNGSISAAPTEESWETLNGSLWGLSEEIMLATSS